jgi:Uncharacterized homolog of PSP1
MDKNQDDIDTNPFLSRGCSHHIKIYQKNESAFSHGMCKLDVYDWLKNTTLPESKALFDCVEIRFKNNRKDFFRITPDMDLHVGDIAAVEASPGHDIGIVSATGDVVRFQLKRRGINYNTKDFKKVYRKARTTDIEKWITSVEKENPTMYKAREIAAKLNLKMKINDVEYQGDDTKAIFYYTADERIDFRELIKLLADDFKTRIEMRQIGVRQEASRLGGLGSCGRELCCCTWLTNFNSVTTNAARIQQLSLNPQKLAGQCGKLKCCLNYEYATYQDALKEFPNSDIVLKTKKGEANHQKTDIFKKMMWYAYLNDQSNMLAISIDKVAEIISKNAKGILPDKLEDFAMTKEQKTEFENGVGQDDLNRFDK